MKKKKGKILIPTIFILIFLIVLISNIRKFSLATNINITSKIYLIENNIITNISSKTNIDLYKKYFDLDNCYIKITNESNEEINSGYIYTGSKTVVYNNEGSIINTYTNIVIGDITKDGIVNEKDLKSLAKYLINNNNLNEYEIKAIDINKDNQIKINDLTLLEDTINSKYISLELDKEELTIMTTDNERIIPTINPNIILNQNLNWSSSDETIAAIDESGKITAKREGTVTITATTKDNELSRNIELIIDNTPKLEKNSITLYTGGDKQEISIKAVNYNELSCISENTDVATCEIQDKNLILTPINDGTTKVKVISPTYGTVEITVKTLYTYFTVFPKSWCLKPRESHAGGIISGFNFGNLSVESISDESVIIRAVISRYSLGIESWTNTGDADVIFTESNGHNKVKFTAHVYKLDLASKSGTTTVGNNITVEITSDNTGDLSCTSNNSEIATCNIENSTLSITPIKDGEVTITINGSKCGSEEYRLTVTKEGDTP